MVFSDIASFLTLFRWEISAIDAPILLTPEVFLFGWSHARIFTEKTLLILKFHDFFHDFIDIIGFIVYLKTTKWTKHSLIFDDTITIFLTYSCLLKKRINLCSHISTSSETNSISFAHRYFWRKRLFIFRKSMCFSIF